MNPVDAGGREGGRGRGAWRRQGECPTAGNSVGAGQGRTRTAREGSYETRVRWLLFVKIKSGNV